MVQLLLRKNSDFKKLPINNYERIKDSICFELVEQSMPLVKLTKCRKEMIKHVKMRKFHIGVF